MDGVTEDNTRIVWNTQINEIDFVYITLITDAENEMILSILTE